MTQEMIMFLFFLPTFLGTMAYVVFSKVKGEGEGNSFLKVESSFSSKSSYELGKKKEKKKIASFRGEHRRY